MTTRLTTEVLLARDEIVAAPAQRACGDQSFELPGGIYVAMVLMFASFVAVLSLAFRGHMAVSFGVIFAFLAAFFAVPSLFPRMKPQESRTRALSWSRFMQKGIRTATGRTSAKDATILVLLLPFLILSFSVAVATIAALV
jgi:hypothetical protein